MFFLSLSLSLSFLSKNNSLYVFSTFQNKLDGLVAYENEVERQFVNTMEVCILFFLYTYLILDGLSLAAIMYLMGNIFFYSRDVFLYCISIACIYI